MSDVPGPRTGPRRLTENRILESVGEPAALVQIVTGPRGSGKSHMLRRLATRLGEHDANDPIPVLIDLEPLCTIPTEFALRYVAQVDDAARASGAAPGPKAAQMRSRLEREAASSRPDPALLMDLAFSYPQLVAEETERRLALLMDELGETARFARHSGLGQCKRLIAKRLAAGRDVTIVAAVGPASRPERLLSELRAQVDDRMRIIDMPDLETDEILALLTARGCSPSQTSAIRASVLKATAGRPLYAEVLARRLTRGESLASTLLAELTPPLGALHQECRFDYHLLVERSRGHAAVRTILQLLARESRLNLSVIARHLHVALPTALDYLSWLLEVGLIRRDGPDYVFADPLLHLWLILNGPEAADPRREVERFLREPIETPQPPARPRGPRPARRRIERREDTRPRRPTIILPPAQNDSLIEID